MVSFSEAIRKGFEGYLQFSGRSTRSEYWWWSLFYTVVAVVAFIINWVSFGPENNILGGLVGLVFLLPNIAVSVRRLHDINKTGLWFLWWFLMLIGAAIVMLIGGLIFGFMSESAATGGWVFLVIGLILGAIGYLAIFIWWITWFVQQGDTGPNNYGPDPRDDSQEFSDTGEAEESSDDSQSDEIHCPVCSLGNKANSKFCKQCGGSLENAT